MTTERNDERRRRKDEKIEEESWLLFITEKENKCECECLEERYRNLAASERSDTGMERVRGKRGAFRGFKLSEWGFNVKWMELFSTSSLFWIHGTLT